MRILVAGGGSGGHIAPVLAVIETLEEKYPDAEVLYIGSKKGIENKIIPKTDISFKSIETGKFRRYHKNKILNLIDPTTFVKNFGDLFRAIKGVFESYKIIKEFGPNSIFIKGGFVSLPVGIAAKILGYPFVIHESDAIPGLANKILSKWAKYILVSYPKKFYVGIFPEEKLVYSGSPVRKDILKGESKRGFEAFKLKKEIPTILVIGGSQGSKAINMVVEGALEDLLDKYQLIHITGELDYDWVDYRASKLAKDLQDKYRFYNFLSAELKDAFKISDLVISRAGNNVLTEIAALQKPSILIPLPSSANNHQYENAIAFSRKGAAYVIEEHDLAEKSLKKQIDYLFEHKNELEYMAEKVKIFYKEDASDIIVEKINEIKIAGKKKDEEPKEPKEGLQEEIEEDEE